MSSIKLFQNDETALKVKIKDDEEYKNLNGWTILFSVFKTDIDICHKVETDIDEVLIDLSSTSALSEGIYIYYLQAIDADNNFKTIKTGSISIEYAPERREC